MKTLMAILTILSIIFSNQLPAQAPNFVWARSAEGAGPDHGNDIAVDASGNSYVVGVFESDTLNSGPFVLTNAGVGDMFLLKYDSDGTILWAKSAGGTSYDYGRSIAVDVSGNCYVIGAFDSPVISFDTMSLANSGSSRDVFVAKYDPSGNPLWVKRANSNGADFGQAIAVDTIGNSYVTGYFGGTTMTIGSVTLTSAGPGDMFVAKYDPFGALSWARSAGGPGSEVSNSIALDGSGNSYVTGYFSGSTMTVDALTLINSGVEDIFLVKLDTDGNAIWATNPDGSGADRSNDIAVDVSGNCSITGNFLSSTIAFGSTTLTNTGYHDLFTARYDANGNLLWAKNARSYASDLGIGVTVDNSHHTYVIGFFAGDSINFGPLTLVNGGLGSTLFVVEYDGGGNINWAKKADGTGGQLGSGVALDPSGNGYITGSYATSSLIFFPDTLPTPNSFGVFVSKFEASYTPSFTILASAGPNGSITPSGIVQIDSGNNAGFITTPNPGYLIDNIFVDGIHVDSTLGYTFYNVTSSHTIHATFKVGNTPPDTGDVQFTIPLRVADNGTKSDTLYFGVHSQATYCADPLLGEEEIPPPPVIGVFDARFTDPSLSNPSGCFFVDMRLDLRKFTAQAQVDTYRVMFQPGSGGYPMTFSWPDLNSNYSGPVRLTNVFTGTIVNVDMKAQNSFVLTNATIKQLFIVAENPSGSITAIDPVPDQQIVEFALYQNYPNPFNPTTVIDFNVAMPSLATLKIYNMLGQEITTILENVSIEEGTQSIEFDGSNLSSGIYFYRLTLTDEAGHRTQYVQMKKMLLMK